MDFCCCSCCFTYFKLLFYVIRLEKQREKVDVCCVFIYVVCIFVKSSLFMLFKEEINKYYLYSSFFFVLFQ
jgi:multisubunit Na+/H+ antiporter MnhB subunit